MRTARLLAIIIVFSLPFPLPLLAQQSVAIDPQARSFVQNSVASLTRGVSITDIMLMGTAHRFDGSMDETGTVVFKALATGEASAEFSYPSGTRSEVRANSSQGPVGTWSNADGTSGVISLHNLLVEAAWFSPTVMLNRLNSSQAVVSEYAGSETRNGLTVQHIRVSQQFPGATGRVAQLMQSLSQMDFYLDGATFLPVSVSFNTHPDTNAKRDLPVEIRFSDYRNVSGVEVPYHVQKYSQGRLAVDLYVQSVGLNTGLPPAGFEISNQAPIPVFQVSEPKPFSLN